MSFEAKIYRVLIASPGDVNEERRVIPEIINEWNAINAMNSKILLMPIKWETHSAPLMGDRPQAVINEQLVKDCDLLVGVFWTRIGTQTGMSISGTVEEIEQFVESDKPVMLYFSQAPIDPEKIDIDQFTTLRSFKEKMRLKGLTEMYSGIPDFKQKFGRQLGINVNNVILKSKISQVDKNKRGVNRTNKIFKDKPITTIEDLDEKLTPQKIDEYLIRAIKSVERADGWAPIAAVGSYLRIYTPIDYRDFKYNKLKPFLKSRKIFEIKEEKKSSNAKNIDSAFVRFLR